MIDRLTTIEPVLQAHVMGITPAGTVQQCGWKYLSTPRLPCVELTWGGGPYNTDVNNTLDVSLQFNARVKAQNIHTAREIVEALQVLWFDPTRFQDAWNAGASMIKPFNLDPPVQFSQGQSLYICDLQYEIELRYSYP